MAAVCPVAEPARLLASSPAIGHACSLTRIRVEAADGGRSFVSFRRLARVLRLPHGSQHSSQAQSRRDDSDLPTSFGASFLRSAHTTRLSRSLQPPSPTAGSAPVTRSAWCLSCSHRSLRSKRRSGHRKLLDNRRNFSGEFSHARRLTRQSDGFIRTLLHESALHSTSLASEFQFGKTANNALQRTATAVTVAAIPVRCRFVRSGLGFTSVASFFAPPSQLPRQPPRSLQRMVRLRTRPASQQY